MLTLNNVTISFENETILEDINLNIKQGEIVSIIGPSGSGKSTLIRCMNHLVVPSKGEIIFKGQTLNEKNIDEIRQHIGMVFQAFELFPHLSVLENLILAPVHLNLLSKQEAIEKAKNLLTRVNLLDKINAYPNTLSGGQKQRIAIVRSLLMNPEIMLFDEPTSALDPEMVKEVLQVIKDLADSNMTICIVTHEMAFAKEISSRVLFVDQKKILADGSVDEVFNNPSNDRLIDFLSKI